MHALLCLLATLPQTVPAELGRFVLEVDDLPLAAGVAFAADGSILVAVPGTHDVRVLDQKGAERRRFGGFGHGDGELCAPRGLAVADGEVFVADTGNHRIQVFDLAGRPIRAFGSRGSGPGEFHTPAGIDVTADRVLVADEKNDRVQVLDRSGAFLFEVGGFGTGPGEMRRPLDVAADEQGGFYVADADNDRILRFAADGSLAGSWGTWGGFDGQLDDPRGVDFAGGRVYVADAGNHRIQVFRPDGRFVYAWGLHALLPREGGGKLHYPSRVALAPRARLAVVSEEFEDRIQVFGMLDQESEVYTPPRMAGQKGGIPHYGEQPATGGDLLTVMEPETHTVLVHDITPAEPVQITRFGGYGTAHDRLVRPAGAAIDPSTWTVYVSDAGNRRLACYALRHSRDEPLGFDPGRARFARSLDFVRLGTRVADADLEWPVEPGAVALRGGLVYVLDIRNDGVVVLGPDLLPSRYLGGHGTEAGELNAPTDLVFAPGGETLFVVDAGNQRIQAFRPDGSFVRAWGRRGEGEGELLEPYGIACDAAGVLYVTDSARCLVQRYDALGDALGAWGGPGIGRLELRKPKGLVVDEDERLTIVDYGNHRVQRWSLEGAYLDVFGARQFTLPARVPTAGAQQ